MKLRLSLGKALTVSVMALLAGPVGVLLPAASAADYDVANFDPGYLYSDTELFDFRSLSAQQVQSELNRLFIEANKTSRCTPGRVVIQPSVPAPAKPAPPSTPPDEGVLSPWLPGMSSGQDAGATGGSDNPNTSTPTPPPAQVKIVPCLKDYVIEDTPVNRQPLAAFRQCRAMAAPAGMSAAQFIAATAESCRINPKFLIVLLQKEQSLVTANGQMLTPRRYLAATGYGCTDSAPCVKAFGGLVSQLRRAASRMHEYLIPGSNFKHKPFKVAQVLYSPRSNCAASNVPMKTNATAGMYNYTPYQPNDQALAYFGGPAAVSDPKEHRCASYGNVNFWRLYTQWFGDPTPGSNSDPRQSYVRISGKTRVETAIGIARRQFPNGAQGLFSP